MRSLNGDRFDDRSVFNDLCDVSRRGSYRGMRRRREDERTVSPKNLLHGSLKWSNTLFFYFFFWVSRFITIFTFYTEAES